MFKKWFKKQRSYISKRKPRNHAAPAPGLTARQDTQRILSQRPSGPQGPQGPQGPLRPPPSGLIGRQDTQRVFTQFGNDGRRINPPVERMHVQKCVHSKNIWHYGPCVQ